MVFEIRQIKRPELDEMYERAMGELDDFFKLNWKYNRPQVILVPDRRTMDSLRGKKTEDWNRGFTSNRSVYMLEPEAVEKYSSHEYSPEDYFAFMKHEIAHCFSHVISEFARIPLWLDEGISVFLSGQNAHHKKPEKFSKFLEFYAKGGQDVYLESGFAVKFLVKEHGQDKLIGLLKRVRETDSEKAFSKLFRDVYGFNLEYDNFKVL